MAPSELSRPLGLKLIDYSYLTTGVYTLYSMYPYLKKWRESAVQVDGDPVELEEPDAPEYYETEKAYCGGGGPKLLADEDVATKSS